MIDLGKALPLENASVHCAQIRRRGGQA